VVNVFANFDAANYDRARPYFHPTVCSRLKSVLPDPFPHRVLDVACGTGQFAEALLGLATNIAALDESPDMLRCARRHDEIRYVQGLAEKLPFDSDLFEMLTVGLAIHWFDQEAFLREAHRVLRANGWLVVFDSGFCESMRGQPAFSSWLDEYRERFPSPPRARDTLNEELMSKAPFLPFHSEPIEHVVEYTPEELAAYARSQSGVLDALQSERASDTEIDAWLQRTLPKLFRTSTAMCEHRGRVWVYRKTV
jgi:ubiquinone/menaquinone biosynthesis C-methylase UbiE